METCTLPIIRKFPNYKNLIECGGQTLNPIVVLEDIAHLKNKFKVVTNNKEDSNRKSNGLRESVESKAPPLKKKRKSREGSWYDSCEEPNNISELSNSKVGVRVRKKHGRRKSSKSGESGNVGSKAESAKLKSSKKKPSVRKGDAECEVSSENKENTEREVSREDTQNLEGAIRSTDNSNFGIITPPRFTPSPGSLSEQPVKKKRKSAEQKLYYEIEEMVQNTESEVSSEDTQSSDGVVKSTDDSNLGIITPPGFIPSPGPLSEKPVKKKRKSTEQKLHYEIEEIVGYHRDVKNRMWYLIKWKGWSKKYNSFEPIEHMTNCNYLLMKYFEIKKPTESQIRQKELEIEESLRIYRTYLNMQEKGYRRRDLEEFFEECLDISKLFKNQNLDKFEHMVKTEYRFMVRCLIGMYCHQDPGLFLRAQKYKICLELIRLRRQQLQFNSSREDYINSLEQTTIKIENNFDLEHFPKDLHYIVDMKLGENVVVPEDPLLGCNCSDSCNAKSNCCGKMAGSVFAYTMTGKLGIAEHTPIYECNRRCTCPKTCPNRIVQRGRKVKLCIFKTASCGWGVKALEEISRGTFVCEYLGELIHDSEAVVRDIDYTKRNISYLFDLDFNSDHGPDIYCIDSTNYGNVARFINHSCDPNLAVFPVWIDCLEPNLHRLAFFARRDIKKHQEINFDYENIQDVHPIVADSEEDKKNRGLRMISRVRCKCNAPKCREWVFGSK